MAAQDGLQGWGSCLQFRGQTMPWEPIASVIRRAVGGWCQRLQVRGAAPGLAAIARHRLLSVGGATRSLTRHPPSDNLRLVGYRASDPPRLALNPTPPPPLSRACRQRVLNSTAVVTTTEQATHVTDAVAVTCLVFNTRVDLPEFQWLADLATPSSSEGGRSPPPPLIRWSTLRRWPEHHKDATLARRHLPVVVGHDACAPSPGETKWRRPVVVGTSCLNEPTLRRA